MPFFSSTISSVAVDCKTDNGPEDGWKQGEVKWLFDRSPVCILDVDVHPLGCSEKLWEQAEGRDTAGESWQNVTPLEASE